MTAKHTRHIRARRVLAASVSLAMALVAAALLAGCSAAASALAAPANRYALVIGVQDYPGQYDDLNFPDDDAADMAAALAAQGWTVKTKLISSSDASISTDGSPTRANIQEAIASLSTDENATILVYYSGHGSSDGDTPYIIPYDGLLTEFGYDPGYGYYQYSDTSKWITPATLTTWMDAVPAKHRLLILDSCYSGGFSAGNASVDTSPADYSALNHSTSDTWLVPAALSKFSSLVQTNLSSYGSSEIQTLAACGSGESSYDGTSLMKNGVFTYYLLEAAASGDYDSDGFVTVDEAYRYAKAMVKANWDKKYGSSDEDFLPHISGGTGDVVLFAGSD